MAIEVKDLHKRFGAVDILNGVTFSIEQGELVAFLGPSGGGKSTILRIIAGLERADSGEVRLAGQRVDHLEPQDRGIGFVFQHYALFRHMSVAENVGFGLRVRGVGQAERRARAIELLRRVGLSGLEDRRPDQLSGGQRQRVALARALAPEPTLLLLDEPFGAVDAKVREELRRWLRRLHDEVGATTIFVTHDQEEAFSVADRVLIVRDGRLEQVGTPQDILDHPRTEFVSRFVGEVNVLDGRCVRGVVDLGGVSVDHGAGEEGGAARVVIRAHDLKLWRDDAGPMTVTRIVTLGDRVRVEGTLAGDRPLMAIFPRRSSLLRGVEPGARVAVEVTRASIWPVTGAGAA